MSPQMEKCVTPGPSDIAHNTKSNLRKAPKPGRLGFRPHPGPSAHGPLGPLRAGEMSCVLSVWHDMKRWLHTQPNAELGVAVAASAAAVRRMQTYASDLGFGVTT